MCTTLHTRACVGQVRLQQVVERKEEIEMRVNTARALVNLTRAQNGCGGRNLLEHKECWSALAALLGANMPAAVVLEAMRAAAGLLSQYCV